MNTVLLAFLKIILLIFSPVMQESYPTLYNYIILCGKLALILKAVDHTPRIFFGS